MKILMVNKFLYPNGGSETYIFKLGKELQRTGHEVQYFGMEHEGRIAGNRKEIYTSNMDFHSGRLQKFLYPFKILYSFEARRKIRIILADFQPDVVHLNNINFQITPSIIDEIVKYRKSTGKNVRIVATAHDYQWICPNHMLYIPQQNKVCNKCVKGCYIHCIRNRCIHGSLIKSLMGSVEAIIYKIKKTYRYVDEVICPSEFIAGKLSNNKDLRGRLTVKHNFISVRNGESDSKLSEKTQTKKGGYVLYFGRYAKEKGIETLLRVCKSLPDIPFVFAGNGPLEEEVNKIDNVKNVGFQSGSNLYKIISEANFSVYPSEWYENCPFSVMESQLTGTPVIGANIGGIPELIQDRRTGILFDSGNALQLKKKIEELWNDKNRQKFMALSCETLPFETVEEYAEDLVKKIYNTKD